MSATLAPWWREAHDAVSQVDVLAAEEADLGQTHEGEGRQARHGAARLGHGREEWLLLGRREHLHARGVLLDEEPGREATTRTRQREHRPEHTQIPVDGAGRLARAVPGPLEVEEVLGRERAERAIQKPGHRGRERGLDLSGPSDRVRALASRFEPVDVPAKSVTQRSRRGRLGRRLGALVAERLDEVRLGVSCLLPSRAQDAPALPVDHDAGLMGYTMASPGVKPPSAPARSRPGAHAVERRPQLPLPEPGVFQLGAEGSPLFNHLIGPQQ